MREKVDAVRTGEFLSALRRARSLTQEQVAEALCVSNKTISKWESGSGLPDITILPDLAEFYGVTVDDLLAGQRLANVEKTEDLRQKHWQRLYRQTDFRLSALGVCMAVLPLAGLMLRNLFPALSYSLVLGLKGVDAVTLLATALAILGLRCCDDRLARLAEMAAADAAITDRLQLRQTRFSALLLTNVCLYVWQVLPERRWFESLQSMLHEESKLQAVIPRVMINCLLLLSLLLVFLALRRRTPRLLGRRGKWLLGVEYGLCWLSQFVVLGLALRAAFFVQQVKWSTQAAWKLVYRADQLFSPLMLLLVLTFAAYSLMKREEQ